MAILTDLPGELLLLIFCQLDSLSALLALSSTNHTLRTLLRSNVSGILDSACVQTSLLSTAKVHADTVREICFLSEHPCDCDTEHIGDPWSIPEVDHWSKDPNMRAFVSDAATPFPAELRPVRAIARVMNTTLTAAGLAYDFWNTKTDSCPANHEFRFNASTLAQAHLFLCQSAITHFSEAHRDRLLNVLSAVPSAFLYGAAILSDVLEAEIDMATQERLGISDPDTNMEGKDLLDTDQQHCIRQQWSDFDFLFRNEVWNHITKKRDPDEWQAAIKKVTCERPPGCTCPKTGPNACEEELVDWNEMPAEWWKTWKDLE